MLAIIHAQANNFVRVWDGRSQLQRVERQELAPGLELRLRPGKDLLQSLLSPLEKRTHGEAFLPICSVCTTQPRRTRIHHCLFMRDTCAPGSIRTTSPVTHEYHREPSFFPVSLCKA